jgi:hypothetical protein
MVDGLDAPGLTTTFPVIALWWTSQKYLYVPLCVNVYV